MVVVEQVVLHKTVRADGRVTSEIHFSGPTTYHVLVELDRRHWRVAAFDVQAPSANP
jgi:hypothetical protein